MKISHFVENLNRGGLERTVIDLVRAQLQLGHECQVICLFEAGMLAAEMESLGVAVHACGKRRGLDLEGIAARARPLASSSQRRTAHPQCNRSLSRRAGGHGPG